MSLPQASELRDILGGIQEDAAYIVRNADSRETKEIFSMLITKIGNGDAEDVNDLQVKVESCKEYLDRVEEDIPENIDEDTEEKFQNINERVSETLE